MIKSLIIFLLCVASVSAQTQFGQQTEVRGSIRDAETFEPYENVNIEVVGGDYTATDSSGNFEITAKVGDQLIIRHEDFQTIYHTVAKDDILKIEVTPEDLKEAKKQVPKERLRPTSQQQFKSNLDSAKTTLKKDAKISIEYVTEALATDQRQPLSDTQKATAYELLGDIYTYWKQHDLAVSNYKLSIRDDVTINRTLKLAIAYRNNNSYQESLAVYEKLKAKDLSNWQKLERLEGLGDTYKKTGDPDNAINYYQQALQVAEKHLFTPKITDLNSKIAEAYNDKGDTRRSADYFQNSLNLASTQNRKRSAEEKDKVADFYSKNRAFDEEIELRQEALEDIQVIEADEGEAPENESALTPQKQNYKIANAYAAQRNFDDAISYLKESIVEADTKNDLTVKKDATRKLGEVYREKGDLRKAEETFKDYEVIVDKLYIQKEQEISQAARFSRDLSLKQTRITSLEKDRELNESRYQLAQENQSLIAQSNDRQKYIIWALTALALALLIAAYFMYRNNRQQKFANNLLALKSLRSQMNPHFIFNALNSVNSFIATNDERAANRYLSEFSGLMRAVLENSEEDFIPLSKEIEQLQRYVKLEHFRFQDKFDYDITIDEAIPAEDFQIPPMLLQPYVENAVWHGLRYKEDKGHLGIKFELQSNETVKITIEDNGIGRTQSKAIKTKHQKKKQQSQGMSNIKRRVQILNDMYSERIAITISDLDADETGTRVEVTLRR